MSNYKDNYPNNIESPQRVFYQYSADIDFDYSTGKYPTGNESSFLWEDYYIPTEHTIGGKIIKGHVWKRIKIGTEGIWTLPIRLSTVIDEVLLVLEEETTESNKYHFDILFDTGVKKTTSTFEIKNGTDGNDGIDGDDGVGFDSITVLGPELMYSANVLAHNPAYNHITTPGILNQAYTSNGDGTYRWDYFLFRNQLDDGAGVGDTNLLFSADKILSLLGISSYGIKYAINLFTDLPGIVDMSEGDLAVIINDPLYPNRPVYRYDGANWNFMFELDSTHNHDSRYTLTTDLITSGSGNLVEWTNIFNVPTLLSNLGANNGLTITGDNIELGGILIKNTTIDLNNNNILFNNSGEFAVQSGVLGSTDTYYLGASNITGPNLGSGFGVFSSAMLNSGIKITPLEMLIVDLINTRGLVYQNDYSANYTNRSLVDKEYVDNKLLSNIPLENSINIVEITGFNGTSWVNTDYDINSSTYSRFRIGLNYNDSGNLFPGVADYPSRNDHNHIGLTYKGELNSTDQLNLLSYLQGIFKVYDLTDTPTNFPLYTDMGYSSPYTPDQSAWIELRDISNIPTNTKYNNIQIVGDQDGPACYRYFYDNGTMLTWSSWKRYEATDTEVADGIVNNKYITPNNMDKHEAWIGVLSSDLMTGFSYLIDGYIKYRRKNTGEIEIKIHNVEGSILALGEHGIFATQLGYAPTTQTYIPIPGTELGVHSIYSLLVRDDNIISLHNSSSITGVILSGNFIYSK